MSLIAGERPDEARSIVSSDHGDRRQLKTCDPTLGAVLEEGHIVGRERQSHGAAEEVSRLCMIEPKVESTDLGQEAAGTEPCEGQRRIHGRGDDEMRLLR
jgi:hypothetical protein